MTPKIVTVIQARTTSTRLPGKVMLPLAGEPLLLRMIERVCLAKTVGTVVVATTTDSADDVVVELCTQHGIDVYRGHPLDLLDRHVQVGIEFNADAVVKIPSDCPLIDPAVIDQVIGEWLANPHIDYVSNLHPATWPDGNDVEVVSMSALTRAHEEAYQAIDREHTTPYLWQNPHLFSIANVEWQVGLNLFASHRWTIDYQEDYEFISTVYRELYDADKAFGVEDILQLLRRRPEIADINAVHAGETWMTRRKAIA